MAAKPSPNPRMPRATSKSVMSNRCEDVPSTRNLLDTPSVAQSLDGYSRLKGSLRFPGSTLDRLVGRRYSELADSVLQPETWPPLKPLENQRLRCSEVPWVKESGTT